MALKRLRCVVEHTIPLPNSDKHLLNPAFCEPQHLELLRFMGRMFGLAIRSKHTLTLNLGSMFWKSLAQEPCTLSDLDDVDTTTASLLRQVRGEDRATPLTKAEYQELFHSVTWQVVGCTGDRVRSTHVFLLFVCLFVSTALSVVCHGCIRMASQPFIVL